LILLRQPLALDLEHRESARRIQPCLSRRFMLTPIDAWGGIEISACEHVSGSSGKR